VQKIKSDSDIWFQQPVLAADTISNLIIGYQILVKCLHPNMTLFSGTKVAGVKVYLRRNRNSRAHAVTACIRLWCHGPQLAHTTEIGLMKIKKCPCGTLSKPTVAVTSRADHMHLLHGIKSFKFVSDIPLPPATLLWYSNVLNRIYICAKTTSKRKYNFNQI